MPIGRPAHRLLARTATVLAASTALVGAYRLALLVSAARVLPRARAIVDHPERGLRFTIVVPAHDEEAGLPATLRSLRGLDYPPELVEIVVVADNCKDRTEDVARAAGATVLVRDAPADRGKGQALAFAFATMGERSGDVVVVIDADCEAAPNLLLALARRLSKGARAVQADYRAGNPAASRRAALRYAGFALQNTIRPAGRAGLGLSAGLLGTGMAFRRELLAEIPWTAFSFAEDREQHLRLVARGERVEFAPETWVTSPMPATGAQARRQEARWESGRVGLLRAHSPRLMLEGLRHGDAARIDAALEPLLPPQAAGAAVNVAAIALAHRAGRRGAMGLSVFATAAQAVFVLGGLRVARAPRVVYLALLAAPIFVAGRLRSLAGAFGRSGPVTWERTGRSDST